MRLRIPGVVAATAVETARPAGADVIVLVAAQFVLVLLRDGPYWNNTYAVTVNSA